MQYHLVKILCLISLNPNLTWKIIYENQNKLWKLYYISRNEFNKNKYVRERLISKKYFNIWYQKYIKIKKERNKWKIIYDCCIHEYNMRLRDNKKK